MKRLNTPNKLTLLRMCCVVFIIVLFILDIYLHDKLVLFTISNNTYTWTRLIILILFIIGSISDFLDGHIARKYNLVTTFGKFLDPIADKLLVNVTAFFVFATAFEGKWIIIPIIYIFRDTIVDGIRLIAAQKNIVIAASFFGKAKTTAQMITLILCLSLAPLAVTYTWLEIILIVIACISAVISLASGIEYFIKNKNLIFED